MTYAVGERIGPQIQFAGYGFWEDSQRIIWLESDGISRFRGVNLYAATLENGQLGPAALLSAPLLEGQYFLRVYLNRS